MVTRRRGRSSRGRRGPRRVLSWITSFIDESATIAAGVLGTSEIGGGFRATERKGLTLIRMIGTFQLRPISADASAMFRIGITTMHPDQVASSGWPDPGSDTEAWIWWHAGWFERTAGGPQQYHTEFDVKSKRKFDYDDEELWFLVENDSGSGSSFTYARAVRALVALP